MKKTITRLWFKYQLSQGKLIKVNDSHRNIGKTTILVAHSVKHDIPILVGSQVGIDYIYNINPRAKTIGFAPNFMRKVFELDFPNGVLIEESVQDDLVAMLQSEYHDKIIIKGGFRSEN